ATPPDDVHPRRGEGVRAAHHRADVEVMAPVLDRDVEGVATRVELGDDRLDGPVAEAVLDVAPVAVLEQLGVVALVVRPRLAATGPRPDADVVLRHLAIVAHLVRTRRMPSGAARGRSFTRPPHRHCTSGTAHP